MIVCDECDSTELHFVGHTADGRPVYECLSCGLIFVEGDIEPEQEMPMDELVDMPPTF